MTPAPGIRRMALPGCGDTAEAFNRGYRAAYGATLVGVEHVNGQWFACYVEPRRHYYMPRDSQ